jgi:hypothetical protein
MVQPGLETLVAPDKLKLPLLREKTSNKTDSLAQFDP